MAEKDTASRKWQLTFNNPQEHGWTHEKIREVLRTFKTMCYWCMADEIGAGEHTPHTHLFINLAPSNCRFSTLKSKFPGAHIEKVLGTSRENRDYIRKDGKWKDSEKGTTSVDGTFEEFGECPEEHQGKSREADRKKFEFSRPSIWAFSFTLSINTSTDCAFVRLLSSAILFPALSL